MTAREQLHLIVEELPEGEVPVARRLLLALAQPIEPVELAYSNAPDDDEPVDDDLDGGVAEALREIQAGETYSMEEVKRNLGIA